MTEVLGVIAFAVSLGLATLEIWRTFFRKAKLATRLIWAYRNGVLDSLEIIVMNTGYRKTAVLEAYFRSDDDKGPEYGRGSGKVREELPIVLDVDEVKKFTAGASRNMRDHAKSLVLVDIHEKMHEFSLPASHRQMTRSSPSKGEPQPSPSARNPFSLLGFIDDRFGAMGSAISGPISGPIGEAVGEAVAPR